MSLYSVDLLEYSEDTGYPIEHVLKNEAFNRQRWVDECEPFLNGPQANKTRELERYIARRELGSCGFLNDKPDCILYHHTIDSVFV